jgi:hypothetical protein
MADLSNPALYWAQLTRCEEEINRVPLPRPQSFQTIRQSITSGFQHGSGGCSRFPVSRPSATFANPRIKRCSACRILDRALSHIFAKRWAARRRESLGQKAGLALPKPHGATNSVPTLWSCLDLAQGRRYYRSSSMGPPRSFVSPSFDLSAQNPVGSRRLGFYFADIPANGCSPSGECSPERLEPGSQGTLTAGSPRTIAEGCGSI